MNQIDEKALPYLDRRNLFTTAALIFAAGVLLIYMFFGLFSNFSSDSIGRDDWDLNLFYFEFVRQSVQEYHQLPVWNPFYLGGMPVLENPQLAFLSPSNLLTFVFGTVIGLRVAVFFYFFMGLSGAIFLFHKVVNAPAIPTLAGTITFLASGFFIQHLYAGHTQSHPALLTPWYLAF